MGYGWGGEVNGIGGRMDEAGVCGHSKMLRSEGAGKIICLKILIRFVIIC